MNTYYFGNRGSEYTNAESRTLNFLCSQKKGVSKMKQVKLTNFTTGEVYYKVCTDIEAHHILVNYRKKYRDCDWLETDERFYIGLRRGNIRRIFIHNLSKAQTIRELEISNVMMPATEKKAA